MGGCPYVGGWQWAGSCGGKLETSLLQDIKPVVAASGSVGQESVTITGSDCSKNEEISHPLKGKGVPT